MADPTLPPTREEREAAQVKCDEATAALGGSCDESACVARLVAQRAYAALKFVQIAEHDPVTRATYCEEVLHLFAAWKAAAEGKS